MGVPLYFKTIIETYPHVIQPIQSSIDYLHFDLNCAIHPCCRNLTNELDMFESILQKIKDCIQLTNVKQKVFIAIDGPAPRAKMEQQRQRRLKSSQETKVWDTNAITPGTQFMEHLNTFLQKQIQYLSVSCILSDSNEPGEGEHKIMKFIDTTPIHTTHYVYGLDADLIMLSMIRKHKVYLLRERTEYNFEQTDDEYVSLSVPLLKTYLIDTIQLYDIQLSNNHLLNDYLFLCFLVGNDFIINTPSINIRYNGLQNLLCIYQHLQRKYLGQFYLLDDSFHIHFLHLQYLFQELSIHEQEHLQTIMTIRNKQETKMKHMYSYLWKEYQTGKNHSNHKQWEQFKNQLPLFHRQEEQQIFQKETIHKNKYYSYLLYDDIHYHPGYQETLSIDIQQVCLSYIQSLVWTTHYYFHSCISWKWYYPYHFAPFASDINHTLQTLSSLDNLIVSDSKPYTPEEQLSIVLPKLSHHLIRNKQSLKEDYYYPLKTPLCMFLKRYLWECHPHMPHDISNKL